MENLQEQFSALYDEHIEPVYRFVYLKVHSVEVAEDLAAQVFLRAWQEFQQERIRHFRAFVYQIARNIVIDHYRREGRSKVFPVEEAAPIEDGQKTVEEQAGTNLEMDRIREALSVLRDDYQDFIIWYYLEELSIEEIAKIRGKSQGSIRVGVHRALKSLKRELEKNEEAQSEFSSSRLPHKANAQV